MDKKIFILIFLFLFFISSVIADNIIFKTNINEKSQKVLELKINKTGFESYIDFSVEKINDSSFLIYYSLNESLANDIKDTKKFNKDKRVIKDKYLRNLNLQDFLDSYDNFDKYQVKNITKNIKTDSDYLNLSSQGSFIITINNFDGTNISKYKGEKIEVGYHTATFEIIETDLGFTPRNPSVALDSNGFAHISLRVTGYLSLRYCNNSIGSWACQVIDSSTNVDDNTAIAIDSNNKAHICYYDSSGGNLKYANNTQGSWSYTTVDSTNDVGKECSIAIDKNDKVHIVHYDSTNTDLRYCNNTQGSWSCATTDSSSQITGRYPSIAIDSNNNPHIAFLNQSSKVNYINYSGSSWSKTALPENSGYSISDVSLVLDSNNKAHISIAKGLSTSSDYYCNNTQGSWSCAVATASAGNNVDYSSIIIDKYSNPQISKVQNVLITSYLNSFIYAGFLGNSWKSTVISVENFPYGLGTILSSINRITLHDKFSAIKRGRIVDSTSFSNKISMVYWAEDSLYGYLIYREFNPYISVNTTNPINGSSSSSTINFNCSSISYGDSLTNISIYIYNSSGLIYTKNLNVTGVNILNYTNWTVNLSDGTYYWICQAFNNISNSNYVTNSDNYQTNSTIIVYSIPPTISINFPTNNQWLNYKNISLNFTANSPYNLSSCELWGDWNNWHKNFTWINPTNNIMNFTYINFTNDANYTWNMYCNDTLGNAKFNGNYSFQIDTIFPTSTSSIISTSLDSQTIYFLTNITDLNLNTCKYSIYNISGSIDGISNNVSFNCNTQTTATVTSFGNYTLIIYGIDYAGNENSSTDAFVTSISPPGGGGAIFLSAVSIEKIPVIGIINNLSNSTLTKLQLEIIYSRINKYCMQKLNPQASIANADYSQSCSLTPNDLEELIIILGKDDIFLKVSEIYNFYEGYKKQRLFQGAETQSDINKYDLYTSILGNINELVLTPPTIDKWKFLLKANTTEIVETVYSNKPLESCEIISNSSSLSCQVTGATLKIQYNITDYDFFSEIFSGVVSVTTTGNNSTETTTNGIAKTEQKKVSVIFRVYNLNYELSPGIKLYYVIILGISLLGLTYYFVIYRTSRSKFKTAKEILKI